MIFPNLYGVWVVVVVTIVLVKYFEVRRNE